MNRSGWKYDMEGRRRFGQALAKRANWNVRTYAPGDELQILPLCQKVFGFTVSPEEWRWRTLDNPAGPALILVAEERKTGRIIGHLGGIATDLKVGDFSKKSFFLVDSVVDPSYQGRGIHAVLTFEIGRIACELDGAFCCGLPNEQAYLPTLKGAAIHLLTMAAFFKGLNWPRILQRRMRPASLARFSGKMIQILQRQKRVEKQNGFIVSEIRRFGEDADRFWQRVAPHFPVAAVRNAPSLNWRYFERPNSPYRVFSVSKESEWKGYVVIRTLEKWDLRLGTLVDLFFDPDCAHAGELLLDRAETELREQRTDLLWGLFAAPPSYRALFRKARFFRTLLKRTKRPFHFIADFIPIEQFRPDLAERDGHLLKHGDSWFLSLGDTDLA